MRAHPAKRASLGPRLGRTLFVGDAGLHANANLEALAKGAGEDILATPIPRIPMRGCGDPAPDGEIRDEVLPHPGCCTQIAPDLRAEEVVIGDGERRRRYILCLDQEAAERQKWHRAALLEPLEAELVLLKADRRPRRTLRPVLDGPTRRREHQRQGRHTPDQAYFDQSRLAAAHPRRAIHSSKRRARPDEPCDVPQPRRGFVRIGQ